MGGGGGMSSCKTIPWGSTLDMTCSSLSHTPDSRFTVDLMKQGKSPTAAAEEAISEIKVYYPSFVGALIAVNVSGDHGAAYNGLSSFHYTVYNPILGTSTVVAV